MRLALSIAAGVTLGAVATAAAWVAARTVWGAVR